jgi:hypothetical protein
MPLVGFGYTIPVFEQAKTFNALDGTATVIGHELQCLSQIAMCYVTEVKEESSCEI